MKRILHLIIIYVLCATAHAQHVFQGTSLSKALIELDKSTKHYDISFVYDELEDFTVTKTIKRGASLPDAVREVCGFYPVKVSVKGRNILVECMQKDRTKLIGRLMDSDRQPVAYANIILYNPVDSVIMEGGVSNEAGDFVIPCSATQARVRISCVGFKTIERMMTIGNVGTIRMQMENNYLSNITVSGRLPIIRCEADRLQYIVSNDEFARGLNGQELLSRVPMVTMIGGQAMILGKGPAHFILNGRITEMGDEAILQKLRTMRSEDIERIEVLSIPSGRDMMEMGGGYINIVMRRDQTFGWRGDIDTEAGISDDWSGRANGSVSYASEKFDMTIDAHGGRSTQTTDNRTDWPILVYGDNKGLISDTHTRQKNKELAANAMLHYLPTKNLELIGMLSWQTQWPETVIDGERFPMMTRVIRSKTEQNPNDYTTARSLTASCDWHIDDKGKLISLTYSDYKKEDNGKSVVWSDYYHNWDHPDSDDKIYYAPLVMGKQLYCNVDYHIQTARLDLKLPFGFATIDAGASYTIIKNQADMEERIIDSDMIAIGTSAFDYQEKTKAAYLSLHHDWGRLAMKAGLRYEHWNENPEYWIADMVDKVDNESKEYWLPSLSLSYKPQEGHHLSLSWGTGCLRPNFYDLNPFRVYKSVWEFSEGNYLLGPSRTSNVELNYYNRQGLYACAYHHHGSNMVMQITEYSNDLIKTKPLNCGRINQTGFYLRYQRQLSDCLMATAEGDFFYHDASAQYDAEASHLYGWGKRMAASADWYLNRQHTLMLSGRYQHWFADYRDMTETNGYGYFYFALRYALFDNRLKLSFVANDPFHQHNTDETIYSSIRQQNSDSGSLESAMYSSHTNHHSHYFGLTATYSFGGKKLRQVRHDLNNSESKRAEKQ